MSIISNDIDKAAEILTRNEVIAIPTETVYGLAGNIFSEDAIRKIFEVKQRPLFNPLIVHIHSIDQIKSIAEDFPATAKLLAEHFWPGPLTMILKKKDSIPDLVTAGKDSVAVRMPDHEVTQELLKALPFPLAAPSANPFNRISPTSSSHVAEYFKDQIEMVLEGGECKKGIESTIIGFEKEQVILYRLGSISIENIEKVTGPIKIKNKEENSPNAPGMLAKHYSPRTSLILVDNWQAALKKNQVKKIGLLLFGMTETEPNEVHIEYLSKNNDFEEAATNLYQCLHKLDDLELDLIIAQRLPEEDLGRSINDRLERASK